MSSHRGTNARRVSTRSGVGALLLTISFAAFGSEVGAQIRPVDLGTLTGASGFSNALAVNASGQVVGESGTANGQFHAFSWTAAGGMIDLGTLGGETSRPVAVNSRGQVVGRSSTANGQTHAFSWTAADGMIDLGTLGGANSGAAAVNASGQVVGRSSTANGQTHAFSWTAADGMIDLGTLGGANSGAAAVNASGQVVGDSETADGQRHAFLWTAADGMIDLGTLGGTNSGAAAVNASGQVVGSSSTANSQFHAFSWTAADGMIDLATPDSGSSTASAVNASGQVVGYSLLRHGFRGFSWTAAGGKVDLGIGNPHHDSSIATALNASGQVVGYSFLEDDEGNEGIEGFSWTAEGGMIRLDALGGGRSSYSFPNAVNAKGQVVGYSDLGSGETHAALWSVITETRRPTADTYVRAGGSASANFGASPKLLVKLGLTPDFTRRGYVKFDISNVQTIGKATLRLHGRVSDARNRRVRAGIFGVDNQSWDEQAVTWSTKPAYGPLLGIVKVRGTAPQWIEIDLTAFVQAEQQAGQHTISVALRALEHTSAFASFDSRESGATGPQLVITPQ